MIEEIVIGSHTVSNFALGESSPRRESRVSCPPRSRGLDGERGRRERLYELTKVVFGW